MNPARWIIQRFSRGSRTVREDAIIVPLYRVATGEYQPESVASAIEAYLHDADIFNAINFISNAALSDGYYVTGDEDYKDGRAIDLVSDFNSSIRWGNRRGEKGLSELLRIVTKEMLYGGNTFIEMLTPQKLFMLNQVQLSSIYKIYRNEAGDISKIQQLIGGRLNDLDPDSIIHIPWLQIDREPFGRGLIQPLIAPRTDVKGKQIPPFYKIKASLEYDIWRMVHRRGVPRTVFSFPKAGDELIQSYSRELKDPDIDASFATNNEVNVASEQGGPAQGVQNLVMWLDKRFQAGLQTPINNLLNSSGYTEASARVAEDLGSLIIKDVQMRLKQAIETELYDRIISQGGFDPKLAKIELHWGAKSDYEYTLSDLWEGFDRDLVTFEEARKIMRKIGWELDDDSLLLQRLKDKNAETVLVAKSQQVLTAGDQQPMIAQPLNPTKQAVAQGLPPEQPGIANPSLAAQNPSNKKKPAGGPQ
jgi:hypothetical protein